MIKKPASLALLLTLLVGCPPPNQNPPTQNQPSQTTVSSVSSATLRAATTVAVAEHALSLGKDYDIKVGGQVVATVSGKDIRLIGGDVFQLKLPDGTLLASEEEERRYFVKFNRAATFLDETGNVSGYLAEDRVSNLLSFYYTFYFYDANRNEIGKSEKLTNSCLGSHNIFDTAGNIDYRIQKSFVLVGGDEYTITVVDPNSTIDIYHAIFLVCIEDAIGDSNKKNK